MTRIDAAAAVLTAHGVGDELARVAVVGGAIADIAAGATLLVRFLARPALLTMAAISVFYLVAATILVPELWFDPLGPLVKVIPALCLVLVAMGVLGER